MKKVIRIEGMHCSHCKNAVENTIRNITGVKWAEVDLASKTLTLECDESVARDEVLREAIEDEGYTII